MMASHTDSLVSVVIPTFNRAYCIAQTLDSVLNQTWPRVEVVVVDDGSSDDTADLIAARYGGDSRVRYFYQPNAGVCAARNRGFEVVQGDYVALLDSDDLWEPWKLELQMAAFRQSPDIGMVWTDMTAVDASGAIISPRYLREMYSAYQWFPEDKLFATCSALSELSPQTASLAPAAKLYTGDIFSQMIMGNMVHTSTVVLSRERLKKVGGFDLNLRHSGEDYDFHLRTCREGPVGFLNVPAIVYQRGRQDQLTTMQYAVFRAKNFLTTISRAMKEDGHRISLPPHMIKSVMAEAQCWVGETLVDTDRNLEALPYLLRSLRYRLDTAPLRLLLKALVPNYARPRLRSTLQSLRSFPHH